MKTAETRTVTTAIQRKAAGPFFKMGGNSFFDQDSTMGQDAFFKGPGSTRSVGNSPGIQAKLTVGAPDDKYEKEADAMADRVVQRLSAPGIVGRDNDAGRGKEAGGIKVQKKPIFESNAEPPEDKVVVQKKCAHCEEEQKAQGREKDAGGIKMQRKKSGEESSTASTDIESKLHSSKGSGHLIPESVRVPLEISFGADFSGVRVHTDSSAVDMSKNLNAQAFTHGNDIYFNAAKYDTNSTPGKHLLAHELTHTIQQGASKTDSINRSVNDNSTCDPNVDAAAPPSPLTFIILSDAMASMHLTSARLALSLDLMGTTGAPSGSGFDAYRRRFGDPSPARNKFRNRFNNSLHDTIGEAQASEMRSLIGIFDRIGEVLARDINYRCIGPNVRTIGGTRFDCATTGFALISTNGVNRIIICPNFWGFSPSQRGVGIIHEAVHILFPFGDHDATPAQTSNQRRTEPECYASLAADVNGVPVFDNSCPAVP